MSSRAYRHRHAIGDGKEWNKTSRHIHSDIILTAAIRCAFQTSVVLVTSPALWYYPENTSPHYHVVSCSDPSPHSLAEASTFFCHTPLPDLEDRYSESHSLGLSHPLFTQIDARLLHPISSIFSIHVLREGYQSCRYERQQRTDRTLPFLTPFPALLRFDVKKKEQSRVVITTSSNC